MAATCDAVIIGAGIAGCALAWALAQDGRTVHVIERDMQVPDTFRGELLQPGGLRKLQELGLGDCVEGIDAQDCRGYVVFKQAADAAAGAVTHDHVVIPYPSEVSSEVHGDDVVACGRSFHHGRFVERMRSQIAAHSRITLTEGTVTELIEDAVCPEIVRGIRYKAVGSESTKELRAPLTVDCSGCFSKFRAQLSRSKPTYSSHFVALLLRDVDLPYRDYGYVTLANPAPVLMYAIATGELRVLVSVPDPLPSITNGDLQRYLTEHVAPQLPPFMHAAFQAAVVERVRSVPCRTLAVEAVRRQGVLTVGDALNMRHPLTGGGMTVAFTDVALLAGLLRAVPDLHDLPAVQRATDPFFDRRMNTASTINILAQVLFDVFCGGNVQPALAPVREACFAYFPYFGTDCLGLVSGLTPSPRRLVGHFFAVAAFSVYQLLTPVPSPRRLWDAVRAFYASYKVIEGPLIDHFVRQHRVPYQGM